MPRLLFLLLFPAWLMAGHESDSLKNLLPGAEDRHKLEILQSLTRHYMLVSSDSCVKYGDAAGKLSAELGDRINEAEANKRMGYAMYHSGEYEKSLPYFNRSKALFLTAGKYLDAAIIENFFGDVYSQLGDYNKAMQYFIGAEKSCDTLIENDSLRHPVKKLYSILYTNLGLLYYRLDSLNKPLGYFNAALRIAEELHDSVRIAASYSNIGMIHKSKGDYQKALGKYLEGLEISEKIGHDRYRSAVLNNIANIYDQYGNLDSAMFFYKKAKELTLKNNDKYGYSLVTRNISRLHFALGNYKAAMAAVSDALTTATEIHALDQIYTCYELISRIYQKTGEIDKAFGFYKKYAELRDTVSGQETREKIAEIRTQYETEKKEKENLMLRKENEINMLQIKNRNNAILLLVIILILISGSAVAVFFQLHQKNKAYNVLVRKNLEIANAEIELEEKEIDHSTSSAGIIMDAEASGEPESELISSLTHYLKKEKPFLLSSITIDDISRKLGTNRTYLSKAIRDRLKHNFNSLINDYRIREATKMMADPKYRHISVEGIGQMVGFSSKSTFHKYFKDSTGVTPSFFREKALA